MIAAVLLLASTLATLSGPATYPLTFGRDVAPILRDNCSECHHAGTGAAFSLETYEDVRPYARRIVAVTKSRYMPPWKPDRDFGDPLQSARGLTDEEIAIIERWVEDGALRGDAADQPSPREWNQSWRLGTPDVVVRMPAAYELRADGPDVFRNFVLPIPTKELRYVEAIEFSPRTRAVHHANLRIDETSTSRERDAADPAPGYEGLMPSTARYPDGYFLGWTPGQLPPKSPELAWPLQPNSDLVVQLHLRPTGHVERVQVEIGLYLSPLPPRLTPTMLRLGKQSMDIPAGAKEYVITDSYTLPVDVDVHAVQPHAHYRARQIEGFARLPDGTTKWLLRISDWDFDWQDTYRYLKPFTLPKGATLTMRYTYDNSAANKRNPQIPPQRVHWGQNSSDEMGDFWIQVVAHSASDRDRLVREFRQKVFREDILGYESVLAVTPDDAALHDDLALLYLAVGRNEDAIKQFDRSRRLSPGAASSYFNLATALTTVGRLDEAIAEYRRAIELKPDYAQAHNNLGSVMLAKGDLSSARSHFERAVEIDPSFPDAYNNLAKVFELDGRPLAAVDHLRHALDLRPDYPDAHYNLAHTLTIVKRASEAAGHYRRALELRPDWPPVLAEAAWFFATNPDDNLRDPKLALEFADRAASLTSKRDATVLDVLAAAYAAIGFFDRAVTAAQSALSLLEKNDPPLKLRIETYRQRRPFVDVRQEGPVRVP